PPVVVGASLGGLAALLAGGESGLASPGLVLVDIAPRLEKEGTKRISSFMRARPDGFASLEEAAELVASFTPERQRKPDYNTLSKNLRQGEDGRYRWHWDPRFLSRTGPVEIRDHNRLLSAARNLGMPTLLVRGRQSDIVSEEGASEFMENLSDGKFVDVSDAGHMVAGDRNDLFTAAVIDFLTAKLS
ncbi:MAG: alpha/beta hydrolase, partial [Deltaproteobacteria bacterium]|nr:alpha/beta hydrolase [Deltaproteobacteria bacterium]